MHQNQTGEWLTPVGDDQDGRYPPAQRAGVGEVYFCYPVLPLTFFLLDIQRSLCIICEQALALFTGKRCDRFSLLRRLPGVNNVWRWNGGCGTTGQAGCGEDQEADPLPP